MRTAPSAAADAVRAALYAMYGARAFAEYVEAADAPPFVLVLSQAAKELAVRSPAVRDSGLGVKTILEAPRVTAVLSAQVPLWTAAHRNHDAELADELLTTESIEMAWQPDGDGPRPVCVEHDFSASAPAQIGWLHSTPLVQAASDGRDIQPAPQSVASYAQALAGTRYRRSAKTAGQEMDCSGFVWVYFYRTRGIRLPRLARWQALATQPQTADTVAEGDLAFFAHKGRPIHHVGLVVSGRRELAIAHCSSRAGGVTVESLPKMSEDSLVTFGRLRDPAG
jgi:cell wall-associated NlpC family hydrolase